MCVILYSKKGLQTFDKKDIIKAFEANPHGAGMVVFFDNYAYIRKGFMDVNELWKFVGKYKNKESPSAAGLSLGKTAEVLAPKMTPRGKNR